MKVNFAIIGGGIAGLCAAIRLTELGEKPMVIEGGAYPAHKICGEFLSPECISVLNRWDIHPVPISKVLFRIADDCLDFSFPSAAGGMSHTQLDPSLASRASIGGANIKTNTQVCAFHPKQSADEDHLMTLSTGETIEASHVIIATGRIPSYSTKAPPMHYMGFKAHFKDISHTDCLEMFSLPRAYLGIAPIGENHYNVACLACIEEVKKHATPQDYIENLVTQHRHLHDSLSQGEKLFDQWMVAAIPSFGIKETPAWLDTYFIGDAAMTIPPACGDGLSMGISGGRLAAEYAVRHQTEEFKKMWTTRCSSQIFWAKLLHQLMLNPSYGTPLLRLMHRFPYLSKKLFTLTRQSD
jgi:flavin-dependent dehydrogenase